MGAQTQTLVISGYYGFGNSGDEAVLQSILTALDRESEGKIKVVVLSAHPEATERMYGVKAVHRMKPLQIVAALRASDGLISGGGSLLQDATGLLSIPYYIGLMRLAGWLGKPVFIYAQGIGPVRRRWFYPLIRRAFCRAAYVSVRDQESAAFLDKLGVPREAIQIVPDPVLGMPRLDRSDLSPNPAESPELPVIGISVRFWREDRRDLQQLAEALRLVAAQRLVRVIFLPFHLPADREASEYVISCLRLNLDERERFTIWAHDELHSEDHDAGQDTPYPHPLRMMERVAGCDLVIGMRLHALIYAVAEGVPPVGVSYDPKIDAFLNQLQMKPIGSTEDLRPQQMAAEIIRLLDHREEWIEDKRGAIEELRKKSCRPAQQIVSFLRNKG